jgi:hypothetical protein
MITGIPTSLPDIAQKEHILTFSQALRGPFVGRDDAGNPSAGNDLGTDEYQWGKIFGEELIINGNAIDFRQLIGPKTQLFNGYQSDISPQRSIITVNNQLKIETGYGPDYTPFSFFINGVLTKIEEDITFNPLPADFAYEQTGTGNIATVAANKEETRFMGENDTVIEITQTPDKPLTDFAGAYVQFSIFATGQDVEKGFGYLEHINGDSFVLKNCYRGYFESESQVEHMRKTLATGNLVSVNKIAYVFLTSGCMAPSDIYYKSTVFYGAVPPENPYDGQFYFSTDDTYGDAFSWYEFQSGSGWQQIAVIPVCIVVYDPDTTIRYFKVFDFFRFREFNAPVYLEERAERTIGIRYPTSAALNINGRLLDSGLIRNQDDWYINVYPVSDRWYYLYIQPSGRKTFSINAPYARYDLKGYYHPHYSYLCVGRVKFDGSYQATNIEPMNLQGDQLKKYLGI